MRPEQMVVGVRREPRRDAGRLQQTSFINKTAVAPFSNVRAREVAVRDAPPPALSRPQSAVSKQLMSRCRVKGTADYARLAIPKCISTQPGAKSPTGPGSSPFPLSVRRACPCAARSEP